MRKKKATAIAAIKESRRFDVYIYLSMDGRGGYYAVAVVPSSGNQTAPICAVLCPREGWLPRQTGSPLKSFIGYGVYVVSALRGTLKW